MCTPGALTGFSRNCCVRTCSEAFSRPETKAGQPFHQRYFYLFPGDGILQQAAYTPGQMREQQHMFLHQPSHITRRSVCLPVYKTIDDLFSLTAFLTRRNHIKPAPSPLAPSPLRSTAQPFPDRQIPPYIAHMFDVDTRTHARAERTDGPRADIGRAKGAARPGGGGSKGRSCVHAHVHPSINPYVLCAGGPCFATQGPIVIFSPGRSLSTL